MDHIGRIQRAVDYIEEHLKEDLPMESLAGVACFSMWHFGLASLGGEVPLMDSEIKCFFALDTSHDSGFAETNRL